jgi:hypothetical protein
MSFTGNASNHYHARPHKARPDAADVLDEGTKTLAHSDQQILIEQKEGLHGANLTICIPYEKIEIFELGMERVLDQLVITMILAFARECYLPARKLREAVTPDDLKARRRYDLLSFRHSHHYRHRCLNMSVKLPIPRRRCLRIIWDIESGALMIKAQRDDF